MARRHKKVIWTKQGYSTLDDAVGYVGQDSLTAAQDLLESALDTAESLSIFSERGRIVPELQQPNVRELLVQRYRLIYMLLGCREIACACLLGKLIHALPVRVRKLPAKQGTRFIGRQRMTIGTNNAVPNACSKGPTC